MSEIHPACALCKGACCLSLAFDTEGQDPDVVRWFSLRGRLVAGKVRIHAPCTMLNEGRCSIYDDRPQVCRDFFVGSDGCKSAVVAYRPEQANEILRLIVRGDK